MFATLAYYARHRRILWIGLPAQDTHHILIDTHKTKADLHPLLLPSVKYTPTHL